MRKLTFEAACFQWASGFYLTEHVPDKFFDWTENGQEGFMGDHLWEPFEFWTGHMIAKEIASLAHWVENGQYPKKEDYAN